jgi:hypothetical protein
MVADHIDGPRAKENERRRDRDDRSADHDGAPFICPGFSPVLPEHFGPGKDQVREELAQSM